MPTEVTGFRAEGHGGFFDTHEEAHEAELKWARNTLAAYFSSDMPLREIVYGKEFIKAFDIIGNLMPHELPPPLTAEEFDEALLDNDGTIEHESIAADAEVVEDGGDRSMPKPPNDDFRFDGSSSKNELVKYKGDGRSGSLSERLAAIGAARPRAAQQLPMSIPDTRDFPDHGTAARLPPTNDENERAVMHRFAKPHDHGE